jgi:ribosomal protein S18 acetylase RimI-like enzyme
VPALIALLADDPLGAARECFEEPLPASYFAAFEAIDTDPNHELLIAESEGTIAGFLQISYIPNLTYAGAWRALIEGVRVAKARRGSGVGRALFEEAIERAKRKPCRMVQLTTDKTRPEALAFYEALGFRATHEGLKLPL